MILKLLYTKRLKRFKGDHIIKFTISVAILLFSNFASADVVFVFVPGLNGRIAPKLMMKPPPFSHAQKLLKERDIAFVEIETIESGNQRYNSEAIAQTIKELGEDDHEVVLIGHSMGTTDSLHALVNHPELWHFVKEFRAWQGPILGTPLQNSLAEYFRNLTDSIPGPFSFGTNFLAFAYIENLRSMFSMLGFDLDTLVGFSESERKVYLANHDQTIKALSRHVVLASVVTYTEEEYTPVGLKSFFKTLKGLKNDGLIPADNQIVPYSHQVITLPGYNHNELVYDQYKNENVESILEALGLPVDCGDRLDD